MLSFSYPLPMVSFEAVLRSKFDEELVHPFVY
jgi:hypothetical protein